MSGLSFFRTDGPHGDQLVPTEVAGSHWGNGQLHGVAISAALARGLEAEVRRSGRADLRPARWTVDLFRAVAPHPVRVTAEVVREGSRLMQVDVQMLQDENVVSRASGLLLKPSSTAPGLVWEPEDSPAPPPPDVAPDGDDPHIPFLRSDAEWSQDFSAHQNGGRKTTWQTVVPTVDGEQPSPFETVAGIADAASMVTHWGDAGVGYINTDITLTLARLPERRQVGLLAVDRVESEGIAVGTAVAFDRAGRLGTVVVSALANAHRAVDLGDEAAPTDDPTRS